MERNLISARGNAGLGAYAALMHEILARLGAGSSYSRVFIPPSIYGFPLCRAAAICNSTLIGFTHSSARILTFCRSRAPTVGERWPSSDGELSLKYIDAMTVRAEAVVNEFLASKITVCVRIGENVSRKWGGKVSPAVWLRPAFFMWKSSLGWKNCNKIKLRRKICIKIRS